MAKYYQSKIFPASVPKPPIGPLTGVQDMKQARTRSVMTAQDELPGLGRRVIARQGLKGQSEWLAADATNIPDSTTNRVVLRTKNQLTPGCFLDLSVIYIPSGDTSDGPPGGNIDVEITWTDADGTTEADQFQIDLEGSTETGGAEPDGNGELWTALKHVIVKGMRPDGLTSASVLRQWTRPPVTATVTLENIGGCRIVDACLFEVPYRRVWEADDGDHELTVHSSDGKVPNMPAIRWNEDVADGDPRGGSYMLMDVHHAQIKRMGPILFHWTSYTEDGTSHLATEDSAVSSTSTTPEGLLDATQTAYDATKAGWSVGNYAHNFIQNEDKLIMRGKNGAIPVRVQVYAGVSDSGTGTVRVMTAKHSYIDVAVGGTTQWYTAYGWLECGVSPEQHVIAQAFFWQDGVDGITVRDILVEYDQRGSA